ncbi:hypothetical protein Glove_67g47 [Diversispora epigaea]|uniref:Uncharacterized protein n=1 Tax=Diversispora epigaea TaxID=1348612 RepID=A0A397JAE8_9GLOM|nr:hypothetical protein Glove_67g47 [Diversispora epigaea]
MVQPKYISQDTLESLFGTIRELGGDSYGHKYQITALVSSEIKVLIMKMLVAMDMELRLSKNKKEFLINNKIIQCTGKD